MNTKLTNNFDFGSTEFQEGSPQQSMHQLERVPEVVEVLQVYSISFLVGSISKVGPTQRYMISL